MQNTKHLDRMRRKQKFQGCGCKICKQNQYYLKMGRFDIPEKVDNTGWEGYSDSRFDSRSESTIMRQSLGIAWGETKESVEKLKNQRNLVQLTDIKHMGRNRKK